MKITVIGAGAMGGTTVEGFLKSGAFKKEEITVSDPSYEVTERFAQMGVNTTTDNRQAAEGADIVCVVVKPWLVEQVLKGIADALNPERQLLIVVAAGIAASKVQEWLGTQCPPLFMVCQFRIM